MYQLYWVIFVICWWEMKERARDRGRDRETNRQKDRQREKREERGRVRRKSNQTDCHTATPCDSPVEKSPLMRLKLMKSAKMSPHDDAIKTHTEKQYKHFLFGQLSTWPLPYQRLWTWTHTVSFPYIWLSSHPILKLSHWLCPIRKPLPHHQPKHTFYNKIFVLSQWDSYHFLMFYFFACMNNRPNC